MFANSFQNMLMIKTGALASGKTLGMGSGHGASLGNEFSAVLNTLMNKAPDVKSSGENTVKALMASMNLDTIPGQKSGNVISALAAVISGDTASKSADLLVGAQGLDVLGQLLQQAGFPGDKVQTFVDGTKQELGETDGSTPFKTVLSSLGDFMQANDQGTWLDISALPFVQTALANFGFKADDIETLVARVTDKSQGISVDKLVAELAPYTTTAEQNTDVLPDKPVFSSPLTVKKIKNETDFLAVEPTSKNVEITETPTVSDVALTLLATVKTLENPDNKIEKKSGHAFKSVEPSNLNHESTGDDLSAKAEGVPETPSDAMADQTLPAAHMAFTAAMMLDLLSPTPITSAPSAAPVADRPVLLNGTLPMATAKASTFTFTGQNTSNMPGAQDLLEDAAKGNISLNDFAEKLESMAQGGTPAESKQTALAPFARALGEHIQERSRNVAASGSEATTVTEPVDTRNLTLAFDTTKTPASLFTDKAQGIFKGHVSTEKSDRPSESVKTPSATDDLSQDGKAQAAEPAVPFMRNKSNETFTSKDGDGAQEPPVFHLEKPLKDKAVARDGKTESQVLPVKVLTGSGLYAKTADMVQAGSSEKTLPAYVTDQVARQISKAVKNGDSEIRFHIKPPDMGRVELSITHTAAGLKVSILAEHSTTRDMIMNQATDLKTVLADQGIRIEKMEVGMSGDFGQSMAQAKNDSDSSNRGRRQKDKPLFNLDPLSAESKDTGTVALMAAERYARGRLDLVA